MLYQLRYLALAVLFCQYNKFGAYIFLQNLKCVANCFIPWNAASKFYGHKDTGHLG